MFEYEFKKKNSLEKRKEESLRIVKKYPESIPVIVERGNKEIETIDKHKYLVPRNITIGQFVYIIRKRIKLTPEKAIFVFINNTLPTTSQLMSSLYDQHKDEDGFLYVIYSGESTFGLN